MKNLAHLHRMICFLTALLLAQSIGLSLAFAQSKSQVITQLQAWRFDTAVEKDLEDFEKDLRISFINRLIFQTERNYQGDGSSNALRNFMIQTLKTLEKAEQRSTNRSMGSDEYFIVNLRQSLQEVLEPTEDVILFARAYLNYSGLSDPASAEEFGISRSYINGDQLLIANPADREEASVFVAEKLLLEDSMTQQNRPLLLQEDFDFYLPVPSSQELIPSDFMLENSFTP